MTEEFNISIISMATKRKTYPQTPLLMDTLVRPALHPWTKTILIPFRAKTKGKGK